MFNPWSFDHLKRSGASHSSSFGWQWRGGKLLCVCGQPWSSSSGPFFGWEGHVWVAGSVQLTWFAASYHWHLRGCHFGLRMHCGRREVSQPHQSGAPVEDLQGHLWPPASGSLFWTGLGNFSWSPHLCRIDVAQQSLHSAHGVQVYTSTLQWSGKDLEQRGWRAEMFPRSAFLVGSRLEPAVEHLGLF